MIKNVQREGREGARRKTRTGPGIITTPIDARRQSENEKFSFPYSPGFPSRSFASFAFQDLVFSKSNRSRTLGWKERLSSCCAKAPAAISGRLERPEVHFRGPRRKISTGC